VAVTAAGVLSVAGPEAARGQAGTGPQDALERARLIHERVLVLDTHVDIEPEYFSEAEPNYVTGLDETQVDLPSMESGGLDAAFFSLYQEQGDDLSPAGYAGAFAIAIDKLLAIRRLTEEMAPDRIGLATTAEDARRIAREGRLVALLGLENGYALGEDPGNVRRFAELGVRYLSLAHNGNNQLADSNTSEADGTLWNGLSRLGQEVVAEANRWGVVLDISHPSKEANLQTMTLSRAPVIASHSSARGLTDHPRNLDDEQLLALARNGGVVHVTAYPAFLRIPGRDGRVGVPELVDHVDYIVDLIGVDHVGISSDFDGGGGIEGWDDASETLNVTMELVRRGYSEEDIARIWGGNVLRVLEAAERVGRQIREESN
jgi:membrane dipeptidase